MAMLQPQVSANAQQQGMDTPYDVLDFFRIAGDYIADFINREPLAPS